MNRIETTLLDDGEMIFPKEWLESVGLKEGDKIRQEWTEDGALFITPLNQQSVTLSSED